MHLHASVHTQWSWWVADIHPTPPNPLPVTRPSHPWQAYKSPHGRVATGWWSLICTALQKMNSKVGGKVTNEVSTSSDPPLFAFVFTSLHLQLVNSFF